MVIGDDQKFIAALFVPNFEAIEAWADAEGIDLPDDQAAICADDRVREFVQREVDAVNEQLSKLFCCPFALEEVTPDVTASTLAASASERIVASALCRSSASGVK
jgi:long-subunit acyl-CoA synthetase (AMP-forming)